MSLIKEPIDVDFFVESKPLSKEEKRMISDFIIQYKMDNNKHTFHFYYNIISFLF